MDELGRKDDNGGFDDEDGGFDDDHCWVAALQCCCRLSAGSPIRSSRSLLRKLATPGKLLAWTGNKNLAQNWSQIGH